MNMIELKRETFEYRIADGQAVVVTVQKANLLMAMRRSRLLGEALNNQDDDMDVALCRFMYPDIIAATVAVQGLDWPLSFEAFIALPGDLVNQWEKAVYDCNPDWRPGQTAESEEKKHETPTGSMPG